MKTLEQQKPCRDGKPHIIECKRHETQTLPNVLFSQNLMSLPGEAFHLQYHIPSSLFPIVPFLAMKQYEFMGEILPSFAVAIVIGPIRCRSLPPPRMETAAFISSAKQEGLWVSNILVAINNIILFPSHHLIISSCTVLRIWPDLACRGFAEELGHVSVGGNIQSSCDSGGNRSRDLRL